MEHLGVAVPRALRDWRHGCRLREPIGIYIGSKTPAEIAESVMAECLAAKNGLSHAKSHHQPKHENA